MPDRGVDQGRYRHDGEGPFGEVRRVEPPPDYNGESQVE